eukprot:s444_g63.t1
MAPNAVIPCSVSIAISSFAWRWGPWYRSFRPGYRWLSFELRLLLAGSNFGLLLALSFLALVLYLSSLFLLSSYLWDSTLVANTPSGSNPKSSSNLGPNREYLPSVTSRWSLLLVPRELLHNPGLVPSKNLSRSLPQILLFLWIVLIPLLLLEVTLDSFGRSDRLRSFLSGTSRLSPLLDPSNFLDRLRRSSLLGSSFSARSELLSCASRPGLGSLLLVVLLLKRSSSRTPTLNWMSFSWDSNKSSLSDLALSAVTSWSAVLAASSELG